MPAIVNWLLRLLPTNPICMRLVHGGSVRMRHLYLRSGYLAVMMIVLLFVLLNNVGGSGMGVRELASGGARMFQLVSYLQVGLICLLTPVFMAGAIAQEANPRTWDILLTTPLNNLQIVLGNLFGRLFFVLALLFSTLPLFVMTQYFGGVPGDSIFASYAIAGTSSLLVAAIAVTLSVTRTAGRRAVFIFYIAVVMYLFVTYGVDLFLRKPLGPGMDAVHTTLVTPINPFLALEVLLNSNQYVPHDLTGTGAGWLTSLWFTRPISAFCWLCTIISVILVFYCTFRLRVIVARTGQVPWLRRVFKLGAKGAQERQSRTVGANPIAWRESSGRNRSLASILGRWSFPVVGGLLALVLVALYHAGTLTHADFRLALAAVLTAEVVIIVLVALNTSATAVSREREDGTLDLILTTPIQPGPYISGKLRGLMQFLIPMILAPTITLIIVAIYVLADGFGRDGGIMVNDQLPGAAATQLPIVMPEAALTAPLVLLAFVAFCVMVGLQWSIKSKGTIGSVVAAVGIVIAVGGVLGLCAAPAGQSIPFVGGAMNALSPVNLIFAEVYAARTIPMSIAEGVGAGRMSVVIGAAVAVAAYFAIVYGMHANMRRTFMMTVRKLAGSS